MIYVLQSLPGTGKTTFVDSHPFYDIAGVSCEVVDGDSLLVNRYGKDWYKDGPSKPTKDQQMAETLSKIADWRSEERNILLITNQWVLAENPTGQEDVKFIILSLEAHHYLDLIHRLVSTTRSDLQKFDDKTLLKWAYDLTRYTQQPKVRAQAFTYFTGRRCFVSDLIEDKSHEW
jgi:hypothetical protein